MKLFVKICGITRPQDADVAAGLGASALGFIFWPNSPRCVSAAAAKAIAAHVPAGVAKVGVFVDEPVEEIMRIVNEVGLDAVQLHGRETPAFCREVKARASESVSVIKAIGLDDESVKVAQFDPEVLLLVDAHDPAKRGGTGRTANWDAARDIAASRRTILAGGLNAANIKLAIRSVRPYGVDVSSGVESSPGIKDPNRLRTFFEALHD